MSLGPEVIALLIGVVVLAAVVERSILERRVRRRASTTPNGVQELEIVVRGRYRPDTIVVTRGTPVRLLFNRQEDVPCSERVIFSDEERERWLAPFAVTPIEFLPTRTGEFLFTCSMGMYQGRMIVEEPRPANWVMHLMAPLAPPAPRLLGPDVERDGRSASPSQRTTNLL